MKNLFFDLRDIVFYDILKKPLPKTPQFSLEHNFVYHKEKGFHWVYSKDYPDLIASGKTLQELREALFDSILTYFDVPRATAKRLADPLVLNLPNGRSIKPKTPLLKFWFIKLASA